MSYLIFLLDSLTYVELINNNNYLYTNKFEEKTNYAIPGWQPTFLLVKIRNVSRNNKLCR